jgi:hypothetical protein
MSATTAMRAVEALLHEFEAAESFSGVVDMQQDDQGRSAARAEGVVGAGPVRSRKIASRWHAPPSGWIGYCPG